MHPLRLIGIKMADDTSDTFVGGGRNYLHTLGFIVPLVGLEELVREAVTSGPALPWWLSVTFIVIGYPIYVSPAIWKWLRERASKSNDRAVATPSRRDFLCGEHIHAESRWVKAGHDNPKYYETTFYLVVGNALPAGKTLRKVHARFHLVGEPVLLRVKETGATVADIRHGEWIFFEVGRVVSKFPLGMLSGEGVLDAESLKTYDHNIPNGYLSFEVHPITGNKSGLTYDPHREAGRRPWEPFVVVSADDAQAMNVRLSIDLSKENAPVTCQVV
jgi:hypothetical protein